MCWTEDTINRELREFIIMVAKSEGLDFKDIEKIIKKPVEIEDIDTPKRKRRKPLSENRCQARLLKESTEDQCSHSASVGNLCKIHNKGDLKYGLVGGEIPLGHRYKFKLSLSDAIDYNQYNTDEGDNKYYKHEPDFDLSLYPSEISSLTSIKIAGGHYLEDKLSSCLYQKQEDNLYYVGKLRENYITRF